MDKIIINDVEDINVIVTDLINEDGRGIPRISEETGISINMLYRVKCGNRNLSTANVMKLLNLFNCKLIIERG